MSLCDRQINAIKQSVQLLHRTRWVKQDARRWRRAQGLAMESVQPQVVDTLGGRMHVRWDEGAVATPRAVSVFRRVPGHHRGL